MWSSSAHTPFFIIANLLSADEVLHCLAIWEAPRRSFLKTKVKTTVWQLQNKSFLFDSMCVSPLSFLWRLASSLYEGSFRKTISKVDTDKASCVGKPTMIPWSGMGEQSLSQNHVTTQNGLTIFLMPKENIPRCLLLFFHKILNSIQYVPSFNLQKSFNVSLYTWSPLLGSVMDREELQNMYPVLKGLEKEQLALLSTTCEALCIFSLDSHNNSERQVVLLP